MEQMKNYDFGLNDANLKILKKATNNVIKSKKCNQFDYASSHTGHLGGHLKMHQKEKSNKCSQCDFASLKAGNLRSHLNMHSGEKPNKCSQCEYASSY